MTCSTTEKKKKKEKKKSGSRVSSVGVLDMGRPGDKVFSRPNEARYRRNITRIDAQSGFQSGVLDEMLPCS